MKPRRTKKFLLQFALDSIAQIESYIKGLSFTAFAHESLPHVATVLRLQFLGFALRDLAKRFNTSNTKLYLARKAQRYDKLTKDYRILDDRKIWKTVKLELPRLKRKLQSLSRTI